MKTPRTPSLFSILKLTISLTVVVVSAITISLTYYTISQKSKVQLEEKADEYIESLATVLELPLWNLDERSIDRIGKAYAHNDLFDDITITDNMNNTYFTFHRDSRSSLVNRTRKIEHKGQVVGSVKISLTSLSSAEMNKRLLLSAITTLLAVVIVLIFVTGRVSRILLRKILRRFNDIVSDYGSGRYHTDKQNAPFEEFQSLVDVLTEMGIKISSQMTELRLAEQKYRSIFENALEGIFQTSPEGRLLNANPSMARILGFDPSTDPLTSIMDVSQQFYVHPERRLEFLQLLKEGKTVTGFQVQLYRKDRSKVWVSIYARPILSESGELRMVEGIVEDITQRKIAETALEESEARMRSVLDNLEIGVVLISRGMKVMVMNKYMRDLYPDVDPEQHPVCHQVLNPGHGSTCEYCPTLRTFEDGRVYETTMQAQHGKTVREYRIVSSPVLNASGEVTAAIEVVEDITDQLSLQSQLRQSQKMEAVGRLAGGVAHDFNNLLSIILGYGEIMLLDLSNNHPHHGQLEQIIRAGERARNLTGQLLAFSRKQVLEMNPVDVNTVVAGFERLLRRVIGEDIALELVLASGPCAVMADTGQLEQVFMNLAVNARDAMPDGGTLRIKTALVDLDEAYVAGKPEISPGKYVRVSVSDTGCGMDQETLERIFEPFFTTKGQGKGTGLGLATSYGIIKQHEGSIWVYSEPGKGTTFHVYLPLFKATAVSQPKKAPEPVNLKGWETILLAEDNDQVRKLALDILERQGYNVISASSGDEALAIMRDHTGPLHLLLTDVVMPGMNGRDLYERISHQLPDLKVIYMSGYTEDVIADRGVLNEGVHFIQKPFSLLSLAVKVRSVLDDGGTAARNTEESGML